MAQYGRDQCLSAGLVHLYSRIDEACECIQTRRKEEAADHAAADMARKVAALDQKNKSAAEKEQSLSSLTAELWAKARSSPLLPARSFLYWLILQLRIICTILPSVYSVSAHRRSEVGWETPVEYLALAGTAISCYCYPALFNSAFVSPYTWLYCAFVSFRSKVECFCLCIALEIHPPANLVLCKSPCSPNNTFMSE